jgi:hypothetical protein
LINYNNKKFKPISMSKNSEVSPSTVFRYKQKGHVLTCDYSGDSIITGHLIGLVAEDGCINMRYHQINTDGELMSGTCQSTPEIMANGKVRLHEKWQWTSGDLSKGNSILEEV